MSDRDHSESMLASPLLGDCERGSCGSAVGVGIGGIPNLEQPKIMSKNELKEAQIDLLLPELCFLFRIAGIPVKEKDPKVLNLLVFTLMWVIELLMIGVYMKHVHEDNSPHFSHLDEIYWAFHSCIIYSLLSYSMMYNDTQVFQMILMSAQTEDNEWRSSIISTQSTQSPLAKVTTTATQKSLRQHSKICVYVVIFCVTFNLSMLIFIRFDDFLSRHLQGWSDSDAFNLLGVVAWYFYSFHWLVAVVCVYLPVHFFSNKVKYFIHYLENGLTGLNREEVIRAMDWYDDLYKVNKLLNFESLSLLTTTTLLMLMLLLIALLVSVVKDYNSTHWPTLFWICTNFIVIGCVAYTVAELETANKK